MNEIKNYTESIFDSIKHIDEFGNEYWEARELMCALEYVQWRRFNDVIDKAIVSCELSQNNVKDNFADVGKMVKTGDSYRKIEDYKLSRYACYLIAQNGDSRKKTIALAQTYFAVQTRKMELTELEYKELSEDEKRLYVRKQVSNGNYSLNRTAIKSGVKNLAEFHNAGYRGLYNGESADDIAKRKGLRYREDILDNMGSDELSANLFRISQTNQKLKNDNISNEVDAKNTHYCVGSKVRQTIKELGGTMPEDLPTPDKSIKELGKKNRNGVIEV